MPRRESPTRRTRFSPWRRQCSRVGYIRDWSDSSCWGIVQCEPRSPDFFDDLLGGFSPDERLGVAVVLFDVSHDGVNQLGDASKDTAMHALFIEVTKEPLDDVEPRVESSMTKHWRFSFGYLKVSPVTPSLRGTPPRLNPSTTDDAFRMMRRWAVDTAKRSNPSAVTHSLRLSIRGPLPETAHAAYTRNRIARWVSRCVTVPTSWVPSSNRRP